MGIRSRGERGEVGRWGTGRSDEGKKILKTHFEIQTHTKEARLLSSAERSKLELGWGGRGGEPVKENSPRPRALPGQNFFLPTWQTGGGEGKKGEISRKTEKKRYINPLCPKKLRKRHNVKNFVKFHIDKNSYIWLRVPAEETLGNLVG